MKYSYNISLFDSPNETTYYLLGAFISDGFVDPNLRRISITSKDYSWITDISKQISNNKPLYKRKNSECHNLVINSKYITSWFIDNGCSPKKSLTVKMPNKIPKKFIPHFIRGLFDGDGSVSIFNNKTKPTSIRCYIVTASLSFADSLFRLFLDEGLAPRFVKIENLNLSIFGRPSKDYNPVYRIYFNNKHAVDFFNYLYKEKSIYLERKYNKFLEYFSIRKLEISKFRIREKFTKEEVLEMLKSKTIKQIAKMYGTTTKTIYNRLESFGIYNEALSILRHNRIKIT